MKPTIAEILRACAYLLPDEEGSFTSLLDGKHAPSGSAYICDNLDFMLSGLEYAWDDVINAKLFLDELGMSRDYGEFKTQRDYHDGLYCGVEHQTMRAVFLLFAADLAEEWDV